MTTLVLLPGMDGTGELFEPFLRALTPDLAVHVVSYPSTELLGYEELESLVVQSLPQEPFVLLGESFSGPIAISIAAKQPSGLLGLVLCCSFASSPRRFAAALAPLLSLPLPKPPASAAAALLMGKYTNLKVLRMLRGALAKVTSAVLRNRLVAVLQVNVTSQLAGIRIPVLYLQASSDWLVPRAAATDVATTLPSTQVVQLPGPHLLLQVNPAASAQAIRSFLSSVANAA